jgi:tetratricopeptide (TPR) repeat protein
MEQGRLVLAMHPSRDEALEARLLIADSLRAQKQYDAAVAEYQTYVEARPTDARGLAGLAMCFVALNRTADAASSFKRTADLTPDDSAAQRNAAMALLELGRIDEASVYAERAARLRPTDAVAHDVLGQVLALQQKMPAAIEQFQWAHRLNPNDVDVRAHIAQAEQWTRSNTKRP